MGTWIELRCEQRSESSADGDGIKRCWSHDNAGPMEMAGDTRASLIETMRNLEAQARSTAWKKTQVGWVCPFCAPLMKADPAEFDL